MLDLVAKMLMQDFGQTLTGAQDTDPDRSRSCTLPLIAIRAR